MQIYVERAGRTPQVVTYLIAMTSLLPSPAKKLRALVVGGGWCGLYALKYFKAEGIDVKLVEQTETIGGIWVYREDKPGGVAKGTCSSTSKIYLHASDYPMPKGGPHFPHHSYVLKYLHNYVEHFKLESHIHLNHSVEKARKKGDTWKVFIKNLLSGEVTVERFDILGNNLDQQIASTLILTLINSILCWLSW